MNALDFAHRKIVFDESSAITGRFDIRKYRMLEKPLLDLDNIRIKRMVIYKASSAMGTVFLQIAMAWRLDQRPGNLLAVMQSDDDAKEWMATRGRKWLKRIPGIVETMSSEKHSATLGRWLWPHQWMLVSGPGENAQQSKQCSYLFTDESHVEAFGNGDLASFEERMSKRWNRMAVHATTAADAGKEVDRYYYEGQQNEWHFRCPKCSELIWPLWEDDAKSIYNGERVFHWGDGYDSVAVVCPHCEHGVFNDNARERYALHEGGDFVAMNPGASVENQSYRWSFAAAHWIPWSETLGKYREAIEAAKLGNLEPMENFDKKRLCKSYVPTIPDFGDTVRSNYLVGDVWVVDEDKRRFCSFDFQEGKGAVGTHFWGQVDEFLRNGDSRRVDFRRLESWADCRAFQEHYNVLSSDTGCDAGHRDKEVFGRCAMWQWYALITSDADGFSHSVKINNKPTLIHNPYYSQTSPQDSMAGKAVKRAKNAIVRSSLPDGWCLSRTWSKQNIGFLLLRLKAGNAGKEYGIPADISEHYATQLNSYMEAVELSRRTNTRKRVLKQIREDDHAFATSSQNLILAMVRGFLPLANNQPNQPATT